MAGKKLKRTTVTPGAGASKSKAATVIYVHGIGNKPTADVLKCQWDRALFGFDVGERSRMAYWVNRERYPVPLPGTCADHDHTATRESADNIGGIRGTSLAPSVDLKPLPADERRVLEAIREKMQRAPAADGSMSASDVRAKILPLPRFMRDWLTRRLTNTFLEDVHDFFFEPARRRIMRERVLERLQSGNGPCVVVAHSQGSMVAYDVLSNLGKTDIRVPLFITIGSPLGIQEVQDQLKKLTGQKRLAVPRVVERWMNICDPLDVVAADKNIANDFHATNGVRIENDVEWNKDSPGDPHSATGYLQLEAVRVGVRSAIERGLFQPVAPFVVARDLVRGMEASMAEDRHPVLIELVDRPAKPDAVPDGVALLDDARQSVADWIRQRAGSARAEADDYGLETMQRYVSAKLTRSEIEQLSSDLRRVSVYRIYRNSVKRALIGSSVFTLQARTAHLGYDATGEGIDWAVLDSGINDNHPHFRKFSNIRSQFDCTIRGAVKSGSATDVNGHGTHVAGIIAGSLDSVGLCGMAPRTGLHIYKVLDDAGFGEDAWIIKALDHIAATNEKSGRLVIHGINLSLGGGFDPAVFGCGDTPLCSELRRLWRQGVLVVIAAGNEGFADLLTQSGVIPANMDLSIGDPANLEEAISVGSVHKDKPHMYGVSYFSSRGPTADGRAKPDLVAPGERIRSCRHAFDPGVETSENLYVEMSGTSMAAPHVSGVLSGFLSRRKEFIGYPDKVKELLLSTCTDLKRDRMHQGSGLPNLVAMLLKC